MKEISALQIIDVVRKLCIDSNIYLNDDIRESLAKAQELEESEREIDPAKPLKTLRLPRKKVYMPDTGRPSSLSG